jgi:amino acid transporter
LAATSDVLAGHLLGRFLNAWAFIGHAGSFLSATALALLAYKGFTTITNSDAEIVKPEKNIGRSIMISLTICLAVYLVVAFAVAANLSVSESSRVGSRGSLESFMRFQQIARQRSPA